MQILTSYNIIFGKTVATIGVFDGVHTGHRFLLEKLKNIGTNCKFAPTFKSLVVTFNNHPQTFFYPQNDFKLLTTTAEKIDLLAEINPDYCLSLDFDAKIFSMKSAEFLLFLKKNYSVEKLLAGYNHSFGSDKIRSIEDYKRIGQDSGVEIIACEPFFVAENQQVSSSNIRKFLLDGNIENANLLLGKKYFLQGVVENGEKIGRKIGFPTANLKINSQKLIPCKGVYSVDIEVKNRHFNGMLYIGNRPTLNGQNQKIEVHIFDFSENIYGQNIKIFFKKFIRADKKFETLEELKRQLEKDKKEILQE
ncbi:MAG: bifunctional riboflavin kinase/FAD synthetase [Prevotellaceae bacterium]|jgi:riboflavin kinase/FMN adenylyltransferase|nr:bifunctional riboflavin kinase/FAD synthetase [Prevotellaceae bacterium]